MAKESQNDLFLVITIIMIFLSFIAFLIYIVSFILQEEPQLQEQTPIAILDATLYRQAINLYDESETFFDYWLYNYGEVEAKGVEVSCGLYDENYNLLGKTTDYVGNVASQSINFEEATMRTPVEFGVGVIVTAICIVKSCDNCEILYERIPELVEDMDEYGLR